MSDVSGDRQALSSFNAKQLVQQLNLILDF